jgi:fumarate reductase flavoprotein subunit
VAETRLSGDILVIGAGTAGLPCAIEAAALGASVMVAEKADDIGGTLWFSGGQLSAAGTRLQREQGIQDSVGQHYEDIVRMAGEPVDKVLVRHAAELAPQTVDWLEDLGFPFDPECPALVPDHEYYSVPRTYWGPEAGLSLLKTLRAPWDRWVTNGAIQPLLRMRVVDLDVDDGRVVGAVLEDACGAQSQVRAPATVLTTGGYAANPALFAELTPAAPPLVTHARETSTGDGIQLARKIGAQVRNSAVYVPSLGGFKADLGPGRITDWRQGWGLISSARMRPVREIFVNQSGQRFINEDEVSNDRRERSVRALPGEVFWAVFDQTALGDGDCLIMGWENPRIEAAAQAGEFCWRADTIAALAAGAGIDPDGLMASVAAYNAAVEQGRDPLGRANPDYPLTTPPYYAFRFQGCSVLSWAGLAVDEQLRVVDDRAEPIPGLYAAGEVLGMAAVSGSAFVGGMSVTPAISFGRWLGERLAQGAQAERSSDEPARRATAPPARR